MPLKSVHGAEERSQGLRVGDGSPVFHYGRSKRAPQPLRGVVFASRGRDRIAEHLANGGAHPASRLVVPLAFDFPERREHLRSRNVPDRPLAEGLAGKAVQPLALAYRIRRLALAALLFEQLGSHRRERSCVALARDCLLASRLLDRIKARYQQLAGILPFPARLLQVDLR